MKLLKGILKFIAPVVVIYVLFRVNTNYGWLATFGLLLYILYTKKGTIIFYSASRSAAKKEFDKTENKLRFAYDKGWLNAFQETAFGFLLLKRRGKVDEADKIIRRVLNIPGLSAEDTGFAKLNLSLVHFYRKELDKALEIMEELHETYKTTNMYGSYGYFLIAVGRLDKALEINLEGYEFNKDNQVIMDNLGQTYLLMGQYEKAQEIYDVLLGKDPSFPEAYYNYAILKEMTGDYEEAVYRMKIALSKEFSMLTTVTHEEIAGHIENLYKKIDEKKGETNEDEQE